jgi:hypothetical protein
MSSSLALMVHSVFQCCSLRLRPGALRHNLPWQCYWHALMSWKACRHRGPICRRTVPRREELRYPMAWCWWNMACGFYDGLPASGDEEQADVLKQASQVGLRLGKARQYYLHKPTPCHGSTSFQFLRLHDSVDFSLNFDHIDLCLTSTDQFDIRNI